MSVLGSDPYARAVHRVLRWCDFYTDGLAVAAARDRRSELESDLWEHAQWAERTGRSASATARGILLRAAKGAPSDLSWRRERQRIESGLSPRDRRDRRLSLGAAGVVIAATAMLLGFGGETFFRVVQTPANEGFSPWSRETFAVLGFTLLTGFALFLFLRSRTRFVGALAMVPVVVGLLYSCLHQLLFASATIGGLIDDALLTTWPTIRLFILCSSALFYCAAAVLWWPRRSASTLERTPS